MKTKTVLILFVSLSMSVFAQKENSRFFIESGIKMAGGGDYINFIGKTGFSYNKTNWESIYEDGKVLWKGDYDVFSWAVAPRLGYSINHLLKTGIDFQYFQNKNDDGDKYLNFSSGVFIRFNFMDKKITPFIELSSGLGRSKDAYQNMSPGGAHYESITRHRLHYFAGSAGVSIKLSDNFRLNLSGRAQNIIENEILNNNEWSHTYVHSRHKNWELAPMLSFTYIFNQKKKEI